MLTSNLGTNYLTAEFISNFNFNKCLTCTWQVSNEQKQKNSINSSTSSTNSNSSNSSIVDAANTTADANTKANHQFEEKKHPEEEISNQSAAQIKNNDLEGIDLRNHASVVIVDYLPGSSCDSIGPHETDTDENVKVDDGFQQVMTRRRKKAEKMKAAAAAANLISQDHRANRSSTYRSRRVSFSSDSKIKKEELRTGAIHLQKLIVYF